MRHCRATAGDRTLPAAVCGHFLFPPRISHITSDPSIPSLRRIPVAQAPHDALQALASLGVQRPSSAQAGGGFLAQLVADCRERLLEGSRWGDAPISAAWSLAVMQVR